jgi:twitching motility protein PilT
LSNLPQYLRYLERPDVRELVLQTNAPAQARLGDELKALTREPFTAAHLEVLLRGTPLAPLITGPDTSGETASVQIDGKSYAVRVARLGERVQLRIAAARRDQFAEAPARRAAAAPDRPPPASSGLELDTGSTSLEQPRAQAVAAKPVRAAETREAVRTSGALRDLLAGARAAGASDVHVMSKQPCQVRMLGELKPEGAPLGDAQVRAMLEPLLDASRQEQLASVGYADFAVEVAGAGRLRVNVCRQRTGLKGCFRLIADKPPTLADLGLPEELARVTRQHQGLVIVSGPNGQGKTTTLGALVNLLNETKPIHIITIEDPVEIVHPMRRAVISQREVGTHTQSFERALKAALREDPDVIAIGELRDRETVEMALSASETGHLVIATMSTPSGSRTIDRLIDMFPPDDQAQVRATLAGALKLVASQRLLPRRDGSGMVAAAELITGGIPLWSLIRDNKLFQLTSLLQRGRAFGMIRIEDSLNQLYRQGVITEDVARSAAGDPRMIGMSPATPEAAPPPVQPDAQKAAGLRGLFGRKG